MSIECVTLSSDSSRPSSPRIDGVSNGFEYDITERHLSYTDTSPTSNDRILGKVRNNLFSLSDSDSDDYLEKKCRNETGVNIISKGTDSDDSNAKRKRRVKGGPSREEQRRLKALKLAEKEALKATKEYQKSFQPGECLKYVTAVIDSKILLFKSLEGFEEKLKEKDLKYTIKSHFIQGIIVWNREIVGLQVSGTSKKEEEQVILCLCAEIILDLILNEMFVVHIASIKDSLPKKHLTIALCGMEEYFKSSESKKTERKGSHQRKLSRNDLEVALVKIQVMYGIGHRFVENSSEFASLVAMFTKAVAETPFKREKQEREKSGVLDWFARGDSKDCVRVNSSGLGCSVLWQQQLRQFTNVGLDVARAIAALYPSPQALLKAYKTCDSIAAAEKLLQNIQVDRRCGPLSNSRKLGPELSRKIYTFFNSFDGNKFLSSS